MVLHSGVAGAQNQVNSDSASTTQEADTQLPVGPLILGSFGLATVAVGAGFGWQAWEENDDFNEKAESLPTGGNPVYPNATDKLADDIKTHSIVANVLMFGGTAVVIGSLLWWLLDDDYDSESEAEVELSSAKLRPMLGPNQASLTIEF